MNPLMHIDRHSELIFHRNKSRLYIFFCINLIVAFRTKIARKQSQEKNDSYYLIIKSIHFQLDWPKSSAGRAKSFPVHGTILYNICIYGLWDGAECRAAACFLFGKGTITTAQKKKKRVYIYIFDLKFIIKTDLSLKSNSEIQLFPNLRVHKKFFIDGVAVLRSRPRDTKGGAGEQGHRWGEEGRGRSCS